MSNQEYWMIMMLLGIVIASCGHTTMVRCMGLGFAIVFFAILLVGLNPLTPS